MQTCHKTERQITNTVTNCSHSTCAQMANSGLQLLQALLHSATPIRVRRHSQISYPISQEPCRRSAVLEKHSLASILPSLERGASLDSFATAATKRAALASFEQFLRLRNCSSVCAGPSMLARQHAGAPAPALQQQQQIQLHRHLHHCDCLSAHLRRQRLAASSRQRQQRTGPCSFQCSAVAAPPEEVDTVEGPSLESATSGRRAVTAPAFPFVRIAGQTDMRLALLLNVIDPRIGGVLIMGDRGTGKSVAVSGT